MTERELRAWGPVQPLQQCGKHGGKRYLVIRTRALLTEKRACKAGTACDDAWGGEARGGDASHYSVSKSRRRRHARNYGRRNRATGRERKYDTRHPYHTREMAKRSILSPAPLSPAVAVCPKPDSLEHTSPRVQYVLYYHCLSSPKSLDEVTSARKI